MKLSRIVQHIFEDRKLLSKTRGGVVYSTGYKPAFGYKSLVKLLIKAGLDVKHGKAKYTNSYYIDVNNYDLMKDGDVEVVAEIRISDHTKRMDQRSVGDKYDGSYVHYMDYGDTLIIEINIVDQKGYTDAVAIIKKHFNI